MTERLLDAALAYGSRGWRVHPLRPGDKKPLLKGWPQKATTDAGTIRGWWTQCPDANVGVATGDLIVIDIDVSQHVDGMETWRDLVSEHAIDDDTIISLTPSGGQHLVYVGNGEQIPNSAGRLGSGIDVRGQGGYVVLPPSTLAGGGEYVWDVGHHFADRKPLALPEELAALLVNPQRRPARVSMSQSADAYALAALEGELEELALTTEGERNDRLNRAAFSLGQLVVAGLLDRTDVKARLESVALDIGLEPSEVAATIRSGLDAGALQPRRAPERYAGMTVSPRWASATATIPSTATRLQSYNLTDLGNAERLAALHGDDLRYCGPWSSWLTWDGRRWLRDSTHEVQRRAIDTVRTMYAAASNLTAADQREQLAKWAIRSEAEGRRRAMVSTARALLPVRPEDLDGDRWLLSANNGTLDLRTGKLKSHQRGDLITKLSPVDYDPDADASTWTSFLDRIMGGNSELIGFLRRAV
ncbi:bifunctional DNA primase/polymerase, partial [Chloroflexota bacterium]